MNSLEDQTFLILSIHEVHAERIFRKQKSFELRKMLPKQPFSKVFLYQTGGKGLVGVFDVAKVLKDDPKSLWEIVGESATAKDRFFTYFAERSAGYAIQIKRPVRFANPVKRELLEKRAERFTAPMSFLLAAPGTKLHKALLNIYQSEVKKKLRSAIYAHAKQAISEV